MGYPLNPELQKWLNTHALELDQNNQQAPKVLSQLAQAQLFGLGVPIELGGVAHSEFSDAAWAITAVAQHSLSAAFVLWAQRSLISYVLHSSNPSIASNYLPDLLSGKLAGATGLSNAIKFLGGIEGLQINAIPKGTASNSWQLNGFLPWVSNLHSDHFVVAIAAQRQNQNPAIFLIHNHDEGVNRSEDLKLHSLQGSNTASVHINNCTVNKANLLAENAHEFIQKIRPQFLTLQSALSTGLSLRCIAQVLAHPKLSAVNQNQALALRQQIIAIQQTLNDKTENGYFVLHANDLFELRIQLAYLTEQASLLELQTEGGACYLQGVRDHTLRRVREALFLPLVSPTISQLKAQIDASPTLAGA